MTHATSKPIPSQYDHMAGTPDYTGSASTLAAHAGYTPVTPSTPYATPVRADIAAKK